MGEAAEKILKNIRATRAAIRERGIEAVRVHAPAPVDVRKLRHRARKDRRGCYSR